MTFEPESRALALPRSLDYYIQEGLTHEALVTILRDLGVKRFL